MTADTHHAISMMLKKAKEKLKTAEIEYDAERYDDSVSRAYYAVFHAISADYDFENSFDKDAAKEDITAAREILKACEEYLNKMYNSSNQEKTLHHES